MSKINQIQTAILSLGSGAYQKLMDSYATIASRGEVCDR